MLSSEDFLFLTKPGSRNATLPQVCHMQHVPHGQNYRHVLYRHLLCHRFCLDPDPRQLLLIGWFNGYVDSFKIYFSIVIVFPGFGDRRLAILRYRIEGRSLIGAFFENFTWLPLLTIFLGCLSVHVSQAIACHMLSIDTSTRKEAENTTFLGRGAADSKKIQVHDCILFCRNCRYDGVKWSGASQVCVPGTSQGLGELCEKEGIGYAECDVNKCVEAKQLHDVVGGYQRYDIFDLKITRKRDALVE
jgi:hypothetical protein